MVCALRAAHTAGPLGCLRQQPAAADSMLAGHRQALDPCQSPEGRGPEGPEGMEESPFRLRVSASLQILSSSQNTQQNSSRFPATPPSAHSSSGPQPAGPHRTSLAQRCGCPDPQRSLHFHFLLTLHTCYPTSQPTSRKLRALPAARPPPSSTTQPTNLIPSTSTTHRSHGRTLHPRASPHAIQGEEHLQA